MPVLQNTEWSPFFVNMSTCVGALYLKVGLTGDAALAKNLCFARLIIGILNLFSTLSGALKFEFFLVSGIEISTAFLVYAMLPDAEKKKGF